LGLASCSKEPVDPVLYGFVEGRLAHIAPVPSGRIVGLAVREGDQVAPGQDLFTIDPARAEAALSSAMAAQQAAEARLADLQKAGRPEEIRAASKQLTRLQSALKLAKENLQRSETLVAQKLAPTARLDTDRSQVDQAKAAVEEAKARLALLKQPARTDQIVSARAEVIRLQALVSRAEIDLADHQVKAVQAGKVETVYRRVGELASPSQPVLALLRPGELRVRFFVPETRLQEVSGGKSVRLSCDGCAADLRGKITFVASQSEFTPPVIFTQKERAKLVWMVEVAPETPAAFRIGQPVEIRW
jgi:HlyD family secretion protein